MTSPDHFTVGILLFEDAEELDWAGPFEVFGMAFKDFPNRHLVTIAESREPVTCYNGLRVLPDHDFSDAPPLDLILVPGGMGTRTQKDNRKLVDWLAQTAPRCTWVTSVCTGSLLLGAAGQIDQKKVTTHWGFIDSLRKAFPNTEVVSDARFVRDGQLVTSAGVSAGIDMSMWLLGEIWEVEYARNTQRMMEYDPAPPYADSQTG